MPDKTSRRPQKRTKKIASLSPEVEKADRYIAEQLKAMYDAVTVEPVPDRLLSLLDRLENDVEK